jgi:hypothetical protein
MSIFAFNDEQAIGEVRRVDTTRVWVRVQSPDRLRAVRVGRFTAVKGGDANEWLVGMIEKIWRSPAELSESGPSVGEDSDDELPLEENGIQLALVGTYRARHGEKEDVFTRSVLTLPSIDERVYPIEDKALEAFMGIIFPNLPKDRDRAQLTEELLFEDGIVAVWHDETAKDMRARQQDQASGH